MEPAKQEKGVIYGYNYALTTGHKSKQKKMKSRKERGISFGCLSLW